MDYQLFLNHDRLIATDLNKQIELENYDLKQQINFIGKLEDDEATIFLTIEKSEETTFKIETQNIINLLNDLTNKESRFATKT